MLIAETFILVICIFSYGIWFDGSLHLCLEIPFTSIILGEMRGGIEFEVKGNKVRLFVF